MKNVNYDSFYVGELYLIDGLRLIELGFVFFYFFMLGWWGLGSVKFYRNGFEKIINVNDSISQLKLLHIKQGKAASGLSEKNNKKSVAYEIQI